VKTKIFFSYDAVSLGVNIVKDVSVDRNVFIFMVKWPKKK
jgi:hypothetical protein